MEHSFALAFQLCLFGPMLYVLQYIKRGTTICKVCPLFFKRVPLLAFLGFARTHVATSGSGATSGARGVPLTRTSQAGVWESSTEAR